jgi:hypothetical protein
MCLVGEILSSDTVHCLVISVYRNYDVCKRESERDISVAAPVSVFKEKEVKLILWLSII